MGENLGSSRGETAASLLYEGSIFQKELRHSQLWCQSSGFSGLAAASESGVSNQAAQQPAFLFCSLKKMISPFSFKICLKERKGKKEGKKNYFISIWHDSVRQKEPSDTLSWEVISLGSVRWVIILMSFYHYSNKLILSFANPCKSHWFNNIVWMKIRNMAGLYFGISLPSVKAYRAHCLMKQPSPSYAGVLLPSADTSQSIACSCCCFRASRWSTKPLISLEYVYVQFVSMFTAK